MLDEETKSAVRDAVGRILTGRERVPGDLPYPPAINDYVLGYAYPAMDPRRASSTRPGLDVARAVRQVYVAGWLAGRECDAQITRQLQGWFGDQKHPYVGVAACLICDGPPHPPGGE